MQPDKKLIEINQAELKRRRIGPDFLVIGAMKAATSAIYDYILRHPNVIRRQPKELHFFSYHYKKGLESYLSNFTIHQANSKYNLKLVGEASPSYLIVKEVPSRVKISFPEVKIIVILRNPTDRAISHYYHQVKRVRDEKREIDEAFSIQEFEKSMKISPSIELDKDLMHNYISKHGNTAFYLWLGKYALQLENWLNVFPKEKILILNFHDLETRPGFLVERIYSFLGLENYVIPKINKIYENKYEPVKQIIRQRLDQFYKPYNEKLESLLNTRFNW